MRAIDSVVTSSSIALALSHYTERQCTSKHIQNLSARSPDKLFVGVIVNNCFGTDDDFPCKGTAEVTGRDKRGIDVLRSVDGVADANHIETFCSNSTFAKYCDAGQVSIFNYACLQALLH